MDWQQLRLAGAHHPASHQPAKQLHLKPWEERISRSWRFHCSEQTWLPVSMELRRAPTAEVWWKE